MIVTLIQLIAVLIVIGVLWWAVQRLLPLMPIAEPFRTIVYVLLVIVAVLIVLAIVMNLLGGVVGHPLLPRWT